jgi:hypothetical protein
MGEPVRPEAIEAAAKAAFEAERAAESAEDGETRTSWDEWKADPSLTEEGWPMEKVLEWQAAAIRAFLAVEEITAVGDSGLALKPHHRWWQWRSRWRKVDV